MRMVVGSIMHESNCFSPVHANLEAFRECELLFGRDLVEHHANRRTEVGGILQVGQQRGIEIVPTISAKAMPSGPVAAEAFDFVKTRLLEGVKTAGRVDAVMLVLHGAMLTPECDDPEGLILQEARELVGPEVPVGLTLDHHANITALTAENADFIISYRTHPHTDQFQVGQQAADLMWRVVAQGLRPAMRIKKVPMLLCQESSPRPRSHLVKRIKQLENKDPVLSASFCIGYPFADIEEVGPCALVVTDNDEHLAEHEAADFANLMWSLRETFAPAVPAIEEAIKEALNSEGGPYVFCDVGDCLMAGGAGDGTAFLTALLEKRVRNACLVLVDPEAVEQCITAGVGCQITIALGGKIDRTNCQPVTVNARVSLISDGLYRGRGYDLSERQISMGQTAVLRIDHVDVVVTQKRCPVHDPALFRSLGIEPAGKKIVVVKDAFYTTMTYKAIAEKIIFFNSPGLCNWDFEPSRYRRIRRPIYPFDVTSFDAHMSS